MAAPTTSRSGRWRSLRARIDVCLFPDADDRPSRFGRTEAAILAGSLLVIVAVLSLLRLGFGGSLDSVWAEDGPIYLQGSLGSGSFLPTLFQPYAGYLVFVPRLIAAVAALVPLRDASAAVAIISALLAAISGFAVWVAAAGHVRNPYLRGTLAVAVALSATAGQETIDSAAYAPWFMLAASFWLLFWRPRSIGGATVGGLFLLATGLSTPGLWFFAPIGLLRAWTVRDVRDAVLIAGYWLGALIQIPIVLGQEQGPPLWSRHIPTAYVQRVIDGGIFGQRLGGGLWDHFGWTFLIALIAVIVVAGGLALRRYPGSSRWFVTAAIPTSIAMFFISVYQRTVGPNIFWSPELSGGTASRYVLVPATILLSAWIVLIDAAVRDAAPRRLPGNLGRGLVAGAVALMLISIGFSFDMGTAGQRGRPRWEASLEAATHKCIAKHEETAGIATSPPPFGVQLPCDEVAGDIGVSR